MDIGLQIAVESKYCFVNAGEAFFSIIGVIGTGVFYNTQLK